MIRVERAFRVLRKVWGLALVASPFVVGAQEAPRGSGGTNVPAMTSHAYVVMVSLDGFRPDYLDRYATPNLHRLAARGARSRGMIPIFPSKTFPNHYSLVTGLRADRHGIVANSFYDPTRGEMFTLQNHAAKTDASWYRGEPIWVTAERRGMVTASFMWPGSEAPIEGVYPTHWMDFAQDTPPSVRADSIMAWLRLPAANRPHLITAYVPQTDEAGHTFGPDAPQTGAAVLSADSLIGRLMAGIDSLGMRDSVYLIVVSDHGMSMVPPGNFVALESLVDTTGVGVADAGPNMNLFVGGNARRARALRDSINAHLRHGRAWLRTELPRWMHLRSEPRAGDVVVVMDEHYIIGPERRRPQRAGATHGWDPNLPSMHALFIAAGPGIARGRVIGQFPNVDVYPFVAELLRLCDVPRVDGTPYELWRMVRRVARSTN